MTFNPKDHLTSLKGRDYLEVKWRIVWFRQEHPEWGVHTEIVQFDERLAIVKASITDGNGMVLAQAHKQEQPQHFGDYLEKAETGAVGRALGYLGYGTQFAPEFEEGERIVDSPVERKPPKIAPQRDSVAPAAAVAPRTGPTPQPAQQAASDTAAGPWTRKDLEARWKRLWHVSAMWNCQPDAAYEKPESTLTLAKLHERCERLEARIAAAKA